MPDYQFIRQLRLNPSKCEKALWGHLKRKQLKGQKFRRQHPIGPYIVDFICIQKKLIIEVDGGQHAEQAHYDESRTKWLNSKGFMVLRFWNNDVLINMEGVLEIISRHL